MSCLKTFIKFANFVLRILKLRAKYFSKSRDLFAEYRLDKDNKSFL